MEQTNSSKVSFQTRDASFEAINGFHQLETVELAVDLDTFGDRAEDLFLHHAIQERRHHVELIERPAEILRKSDNHAQRDVLDDRRKRLGVVNAVLLFEALGHETRLVLLNGSSPLEQRP